MKHFLRTTLTWALMLLSCALFYVAVTVTFPSSFFNIASLITAVFILIQGCGLIDKEHKFGKYAEHTDNDADEPQP